jgi:hypothetical protein
MAQRTVHGSYKPTYPPYGRRPTPKPSRFRADSPGVSCPRQDGIPGSQLSRTMSSSLPPGSIVDMYRPPSCAPSVQSLPLQSQTYGTFYYDYSEDFDNRPQEAVGPGPLAPVPTRIPSFRRATVLNDGFEAGLQLPADHESALNHEHLSNDHKRLGSSGQMEALPTSRRILPSHLDGTEGKGSHTSYGSGRNLPLSRNKDSSPGPPAKHLAMLREDLTAIREGDLYGRYEITSEAGEAKHSARLRDAAQLERATTRQDPPPHSPSGDNPDHQPNFEICPEFTTSLQKLKNSKCTTTHHIHSVPEPTTRSVSPISFDSIYGAKVYSIEPGLSDLASLVQHLDKATDVVDEDEGSIFSRVNLPIGLWADSPQDPPDSAEADGSQGINHGRDSLSGDEDMDDDGFTADIRGHRRNFALIRVDADHLPVTGEPSLSEVGQRANVDGGAPQLKQPTGRLRLKCSASQLMKALPPLPSASVRSESYVANLSTQDLDPPPEFPPMDLSRTTTPRSMPSEVSSLDTPRSRRNGDFGTLISSKDGVGMGTFRHNQNPTLAKAISLGVDSSYRLGISPPGREAGSLMAHTLRKDHMSAKPSNGKLRLRVSRGAIARAQVELKRHPSHITLKPVVVGFESHSELPVLSPLEVFSLDGEIDNEANPGRKEQILAMCQPESASGIGTGSGPTPGTSLIMLSSRIEVQELDKTPNAKACPASLRNVRNSLSDGGSPRKNPHGLRKRISDLCVRVVEARMRSAEPPSPGNQAQERGKQVSPPMAFATVDCDMVNESSDDTVEVESRSIASRGFRGRISRWMRATRHAVMVACVGSRQRG